MRRRAPLRLLCAAAAAAAPVAFCQAAAPQPQPPQPPLPPPPQPQLALRATASLPPDALAASVSSCFTLVVYVPGAAGAHAALAPARRARGHAFLVGGAAACRADPLHTTHWRATDATAARALLVFSHRGGLELPGGGRNRSGPGGPFTEPCAPAAGRELQEEAGLRLAPPLGEGDAVLTAVERASGRPRWQLYLRVVRSREEFYSGDWGAQPMEAWGLAGVPLCVEDVHAGGRVRGFPRALAAMPPWQAHLLLPLLVQGGVLTEEEALVSAGAADAFLAAGGMRDTPASGGDGDGAGGTLTAHLRASLADLRDALPSARHFEPLPEAARGGSGAPALA